MEDNVNNVDMPELAKQTREETIASNKYTMVEILIPAINNLDDLVKTYPLVSITNHNSTPMTLGMAIRALRDTAKKLVDDDKGVEAAYEFINMISTSSKTIEIDGKEESND